jgi:radical SAM protein with 4Fe4S-binding SPASM domain
VLGEPLLHPQLDEILSVAEDSELNVNLTTNGSLIRKQQEILHRHRLRLINISIHDIEENVPENEWKSTIGNIMQYALQASEKTYICLRLWNYEKEELSPFNRQCLEQIKKVLAINFNISAQRTRGNGIKLLPNIYLQNESRFEWQHTKKDNLSDTNKTCYALKDHIAILCDGSVVPCCIDADAHLLLGNIFTDDLNEIINSEKAQRIKKGFQHKQAVEEYCKTCGFWR